MARRESPSVSQGYKLLSESWKDQSWTTRSRFQWKTWWPAQKHAQFVIPSELAPTCHSVQPRIAHTKPPNFNQYDQIINYRIKHHYQISKEKYDTIIFKICKNNT